MHVLVYDVESGGLDPSKHSIFSIGALVGDLDTGEIIEQFEAYHKLESIDSYVYGPKAVEIHGITPSEAFEQGLPTQELCDKFTDLWVRHGVALLGGHNEPFDRRFVSEQLFGISLQEFEANFTYRSLDSLPVLRLYTGHDNVKSGASLQQAIKALNIDMTEFGKNKYHAALFDSICCFKILHRFRSVFSKKEFAEALVNG